MADTKISALSSGAPAQAGDEYVIARSGANYKLTLTNIAANLPATTVASGNLVVSSGNAGVGTASPGSKLDVRGVITGGDGTIRTVISYLSTAGVTGTLSNHPYVFYVNNAEGGRFTTTNNFLVGTTTDVSGLSGVISDVNGNVRAIPQSGAAKTGSYTLVKGDVGEFINVGSGGSIVVPDSVFATGDVVSVFNNTSGNVTITCTITTAYIAGTDADKASVTLATRGVATILFLSGTVCVINGNVS